MNTCFRMLRLILFNQMARFENAIYLCKNYLHESQYFNYSKNEHLDSYRFILQGNVDDNLGLDLLGDEKYIDSKNRRQPNLSTPSCCIGCCDN